MPSFGSPLVALWYYLQTYQNAKEIATYKPAATAAPREIGFKDISFTFAVIALSARVASLDGQVTKSKYIAFRDAFPIERGICNKLRSLFYMACEDHTPHTQFIRHITLAYPRRMTLFIALVERLFRIAMADGSLSKAHEAMLSKTAHMLGLSPAQYSQIHTKYSERMKPYSVLGVSKKSSGSDVRQRYRELMQRYHPDRHDPSNLSPELELLLQLKVSEINNAYQRLSRKKAA
ncbi:MAG: TerB family tellurite resistance protein [Rickettsiales bacterium]|nr:TerB family tellurite resistance protein [Rickettsiales bacterium]